jgi:hypothetical protein
MTHIGARTNIEVVHHSIKPLPEVVSGKSLLTPYNGTKRG